MSEAPTEGKYRIKGIACRIRNSNLEHHVSIETADGMVIQVLKSALFYTDSQMAYLSDDAVIGHVMHPQPKEQTIEETVFVPESVLDRARAFKPKLSVVKPT